MSTNADRNVDAGWSKASLEVAACRKVIIDRKNRNKSLIAASPSKTFTVAS